MKDGIKYAGILTVGVTIIGGLMGLALWKSFLVGAYLLSLGIAVLLMIVGSYYLIGTPKRRYDFFFNVENETNEQKKKSYENMIPATLAVWMLIWGFFLESLLH